MAMNYLKYQVVGMGFRWQAAEAVVLLEKIKTKIAEQVVLTSD
ncbi:MAG TPA: hypothetical protein VND64_35330 [Pirellulales bacterium]|nr:hypothetical protein [Pirellulales bacterium]